MTVTRTNGQGAVQHQVLLFTSNFTRHSAAATTRSWHTFTGVTAGDYVVVVAAVDAGGRFKYAISGTVTVR